MIDLSLHHYPYDLAAAPPETSSSIPLPAEQPKAMIQSTDTSSPALPASNTSFAFLVHSQDTIPNNLPPDVDNKPLARQRRRRTSPEDQAILEEEFLKDSKPDKAARNRIVERVALGEKEVQIWFQNRRQSSRRKSRPLLPHEIQTHLESARHSDSIPSSDSISDDATIAQSSSDPDATQAEPFSDPISTVSSTESEISPAMIKREDTSESQSTEIIIHEDTTTMEPMRPVLAEPQPQAIPATPAQSLPPFVDSSSSIPTFTSSSVARPILSSEFTIPSSVPRPALRGCSPPMTKSLKRTRSGVRLSMTSDGGAKVLGPDESSPSPPRLIPSNSLRKSFSGTGMTDSFCSSQGSNDGFPLRRLPSGRSRDSRAWEFWCDSEARNGLVKKAQEAQKGSATDAISMLRTTGRAALTANSSRVNAKLGSGTSNKRAKLNHTSKTRTAFQRTSSAVGRLQADKENTFEKSKPFKGSASFTILADPSDSDKENEDPEPGSTSNSRRRLPQANGQRRPVLSERHTAPTPGKANGILPSANRDERVKKDFVSPEEDEELRAFMHSGRGKGDPVPGSTAEADLDCIQGLLSLSQGNWR